MTRRQERGRAYYAANQERIKARQRAYNSKNRIAIAARAKKRRAANVEKLKARAQAYRTTHPEIKRAWELRHREERAAEQRRYRAENPAKVRQAKKKWAASNRVKIKAQRERLMRNEQFRIAARVRARLANAIREGSRGGSSVRDLGCSVASFKAYIERLFAPGMTWNNWGRVGWHLDHIRPLASFDLANRDAFIAACHFTNYQPLWWRENLAKGKRLQLAGCGLDVGRMPLWLSR